MKIPKWTWNCLMNGPKLVQMIWPSADEKCSWIESLQSVALTMESLLHSMKALHLQSLWLKSKSRGKIWKLKNEEYRFRNTTSRRQPLVFVKPFFNNARSFHSFHCKHIHNVLLINIVYQSSLWLIVCH